MTSLRVDRVGRGTQVVVAVAVGFAGVLAVSAPLVGVFAAGALVVPLAVLFGRAGTLGVVAGAASYHTVVGGSPTTVAAGTAGTLAFAAVGVALWAAVRRETPWLVGGRRWPLAFAGVVAVAGLCHAATVGWVATAVGASAFVSVVPVRAVETLVVAVPLGPALYLTGARLLGHPPVSGLDTTTNHRRYRVATPAVVAVLWVGVGVVLSTLAEDLGYVTDPAALFGGRVPAWLAGVVFTVVVESGRWVQVLGGVLALAFVAFALASRGGSDGGPTAVGTARGPERSDGGAPSPGAWVTEGAPHRLTRRDAVVALGALGIGAGVGRASLATVRPPTPTVDGLVAVAAAVYPSAVTPSSAFVERYVAGRARVDPTYLAAVERAVGALDEQARLVHGAPLTECAPAECEAVLRELGVNGARADPDGGTASRIRHYVVDELLFALFSTPVGGRLVGIENPPGYGGGHEAYQRAPHAPEEVGR
ncbi:gluconate 2-dehydrogenase subunit 3 family protein [Salinirubellus salinus]|uniref:Gluconate 2-dehydrogenase subunit 3 family protein n=1 Tax=Salinirubellus salinus TaxID=1364945 RepID=A0A9E7R0V5_9EURY|nr:gluconate 2-dehydrogenase subunit 3 family protein [Salinirubellus salinus]UWM53594.1 gluconate 2-dehydrogenase subunit 3 family protein [Salinirubellus salinus]